MSADFERRKQALSDDLRLYLASGDPSPDVPGDETLRSICSSLEFLFADLFEDNPDWRFTWIDGVVARSVDRTSADALGLVGGAIVVMSEKDWTVRPVSAELTLTGTSSVRLAGEEFAVPYEVGQVALVEAPSEWAHVFELDLPG